MHYIYGSLAYIFPFLFVLTVLVFVHEFGHFWVARRCGVKIDAFSIGFGKELFGWNDKYGTRWKISALPLGGYVRMFGDTDETSWTDDADTSHMSEEDRKHVFSSKPLYARAAVVAAGPVANFLFTLAVFWIAFMTIGERFTTPNVGEVMPGSAAEAAHIQPGDVFLSINGAPVQRFEDIQEVVQLHPGEPMHIIVRRDGQEQALDATPALIEEKDRFGYTEHFGRLGIKHTGPSDSIRLGPIKALTESGRETGRLVSETLTSLWQIISGTRPSEELGGVISIAAMSADSAKSGFIDLIYFMALLSVNLGLINLFPIPVLDGGHLLFYAVEAVHGKPLGEAVMKYSFRVGLALVLTLAIFANWNDLVHYGFFDFVRGLIS